ncbi:NmrA family NAD(P)-binding protein [Nocardia sp. NPDC058499]|uniref:NmrA family NAD(P)-binding protein n=1 Tax=Nocardia sp. NPDC058499 TaxID=3346530 RepID=UPI00365EBA0E
MIVLTGPTGNVGAEVARLMVERETAWPFRIAAHSVERTRARLDAPQAPVVAFDYDDRTTWGPVLDGVTTLFLLFPLPSPRTVTTRMKPFIDAAVAAGCRHIVYISVPGADRQKVVPHYAVERHIEASGAHYTFLRCGFFMQNLCRKVSTHGVDIMDRGELFIPGGDGVTTFLDSRDVATVVVQVLTDPSLHRDRSYTLTGPQQLDLDSAARLLSRALDRPVRYTRPSLPRFWIRMFGRGVSWDTVLFMTIVYTLTRLGRNDTSTDQLPELLGRPATTFERWAHDYRPVFEARDWT